jgi:hypothetical protein
VLKTKVDSSARLQFAGEANRSILMAFGVDGFGCSCLYYRSKNGGFVIAKHISKLALHLTETGQGGRSRTVADDVSETLSLRLRQPDFLNANHLGAPLARDPKLQSSYLLWGYLSSPFCGSPAWYCDENPLPCPLSAGQALTGFAAERPTSDAACRTMPSAAPVLIWRRSVRSPAVQGAALALPDVTNAGLQLHVTV